MSTTVTFNGVNYTLPSNTELGWGRNVNDYFIAIAANSLQRTGGSFVLTNTLNLGSSKGVKAGSFYATPYLDLTSTNVTLTATSPEVILINNTGSAWPASQYVSQVNFPAASSCPGKIFTLIPLYDATSSGTKVNYQPISTDYMTTITTAGVAYLPATGVGTSLQVVSNGVDRWHGVGN